MNTLPALRILSILVGFSLLCACNAVLGIEDLKLKPDAGDPAVAQQKSNAEREPHDSQTAASGGDAGSDAALDKPARAADAGTKSAAQPSASKPASQPSAAGNSSTPSAADAGSPPTAASAPVAPVTGTVVDYRLRNLPGISIRIGAQQTTTDADGKFSVPDVAARYDVTLHIQAGIGGGTADLVWQFQGLTRRDPTLQVYRGLPERDAEVRVRVDNVTFPLASDETIVVAWSSPDGDFALDTDVPEIDDLSPLWTGPAMSSGVAHALRFKKTDDLPSEYLGHASQSLLMTAGTKAMLALDLGGEPLATAAVSGKVSAHVIGERRNELYLRFGSDNAALQLVDQWNATDSFSYVIPSLPGANATIVAKAVAAPSGVAAAYAESSGAELQLELPPLPLLATPDDTKTNVDGSTLFQWTSDAHVVVLCARAVNTYDSMYVVTESKQARLPIGAGFGYTPPANATFEWSVETHDAYETLDAAASEQGFLSAYAGAQIRGPRRGAGHFAQSVSRVFTTAP